MVLLITKCVEGQNLHEPFYKSLNWCRKVVVLTLHTLEGL